MTGVKKKKNINRQHTQKQNVWFAQTNFYLNICRCPQRITETEFTLFNSDLINRYSNKFRW